MKVTARGQFTIPLFIRENAGIAPGSKVEFTEEDGRIYLRTVDGSRSGKSLVERMTGQGAVKKECPSMRYSPSPVERANAGNVGFPRLLRCSQQGSKTV